MEHMREIHVHPIEGLKMIEGTVMTVLVYANDRSSDKSLKLHKFSGLGGLQCPRDILSH